MKHCEWCGRPIDEGAERIAYNNRVEIMLCITCSSFVDSLYVCVSCGGLCLSGICPACEMRGRTEDALPLLGIRDPNALPLQAVRDGFDSLAFNLRMAGQRDAAARAEFWREWFTSPRFQQAVSHYSWSTRQ